MRRTRTLGLVALAALAAIALAATTVFGGGAESRSGTATVDIKMRPASAPDALRAKKPKKPKVIYLTGAPSTVDSAALGTNIDVRLFSCPAKARAIEGGIIADDLSVDVQGSYIGDDRREYHVLIEDENGPGPFLLSSHLTCLQAKSKG